MSFGNPIIPWRELERRLSGKTADSAADNDSGGATPIDRRRGHGHQLPGDGGDSPAWSRKRPAYEPAWQPPPVDPSATVGYAELHSHSSFSFLDGSSDPEQLVEEAVALGLSSLALTDHDGR